MTIRIFAVLAIALLWLGAVSCGPSVVKADCSVSSSLSPKHNREEPAQTYKPVSTLTWELGKGVSVEAQVTTFNGALKDAPAGTAPSRIRIRNLASNTTIFEEDIDGRLLSAYTRVLNDEVGEGLILTWAAGSADRIQILAVDAAQARVLLYESYRVDAALVDLSRVGKLDVLITTARTGAGRLYTTRYVWKGSQYQMAGSVRYETLVDTIERQFNRRSGFRHSQRH